MNKRLLYFLIFIGVFLSRNAFSLKETEAIEKALHNNTGIRILSLSNKTDSLDFEDSPTTPAHLVSSVNSSSVHSPLKRKQVRIQAGVVVGRFEGPGFLNPAVNVSCNEARCRVTLEREAWFVDHRV